MLKQTHKIRGKQQLCSACNKYLPNRAFSITQRRKQYEGRCSNCIEKDRKLLKAENKRTFKPASSICNDVNYWASSSEEEEELFCTGCGEYGHQSNECYDQYELATISDDSDAYMLQLPSKPLYLQ
mmetsp:Transcript_24061/g.26707  ORF Transcript_24061/g.26707 Transcript_24061/m.26707 type:complete len:126 (-) Transcript_24061:42-419(-)